MTVFVLVLTLVGFPALKSQLLTENLWRAAQPHVRPGTKVGCFGYTEPSLVWRFRSVVTNKVTLGGVEAAKDFLTNAPPFIIVLPTDSLSKMPDTNGLRLSVHGLNLVNFKDLKLTAIVLDAD